MKIITLCYYNGIKETTELFTYETNISVIIEHVNTFIKQQNPNININELIIKCSELYELFQQNPNIQLRYLIHNKNKYKICFNGYIKFTIIYNHIEIFSNTKITSIQNNNSPLYENLSFILSFLSSTDISILKHLNKSFYSFIFSSIHVNSIYSLYINNIFVPKNNSNKLINTIPLSPYYTNYNYNILGMFISNNYIYLLIQSLLTYNVDLLKIDKSNVSSQEIVFTDEWTYYYMLNNILYQFKYSILKKPSVNKLTKSENEVKFISIKISENDFNIEYYYIYQQCKLFILTKNKMLYTVNNKKHKLINICDFSLQYNKFNTLYNNSKIRKYNEFYSFCEEYLCLSLNKFYIVHIINGKTLFKESTIRNVNRVEFLGKKYFYIQNYEYVLLISKYTFTIEQTFKRNYTPFTVNQYLLSGNEIFNIIDKEYIKRKCNIEEILIDKKQLYIKFNERYYCYRYYNTDKAVYVKLIMFNRENRKCDYVEYDKEIQLTMEKFVKKIMKSSSYRKKYCYLKENKMKMHILENIKPKIFFNGNGDIVINLNEYYWFYKHISNNNECIDIEKIKCICVKTHLSFEYHNIIFTKNVFYIWSELSNKILVFPLEKEKEMFMVSIEHFVNCNDNEQHYPLFIFNDGTDYLYIMWRYLNNAKICAVVLEGDKFVKTQINEMDYVEIVFGIKSEEIILWAGFICNMEYFVLFSNKLLYICKRDFCYKWKFNEIWEDKYGEDENKYVKCYVKGINDENTVFVMNFYENGKCFVVDINKYIK